MRLAIDLAHLCPPSETAYSVGAVIVDEHGEEISRGFSREDARMHAEESALAKLPPDDRRLPGSTIYSTLEPCSQRRSGTRACAQLILDAGIHRAAVGAAGDPVAHVDVDRPAGDQREARPVGRGDLDLERHAHPGDAALDASDVARVQATAGVVA